MLWQSGRVATAEEGTVSMAMGGTQVISQIFLRLQDPKLHINRYIYLHPKLMSGQLEVAI